MANQIEIPVVFTEDVNGLSRTTDALAAAKKAQDDFNKSQAEMVGGLIDNALNDTAVQIEAIAQAQQTLNRVNKLEAQILTSKKGSYNNLNAQLELNTIRLNQMTLEERKSTKEGKELEAQTARITAELKKLKEQQAPLSAALAGTSQNLGEMRRELLALRNTSFAGKTQEEIDAINARIGVLVDNIADLRAVQAEFGNEFGSQLAGSLQVIVAGVEGVVGSLNLLGIESETLKGLQENITSLIAVTQALGAIEDALAKGTLSATLARIQSAIATARDSAAKAINTFQTTAQARAEVARAAAINGANIATRAAAAVTWLWNAALAANPVVLIAAGVAALVAGIVLLTKSMMDSAEQTKKMNDEVNKLAKSYETLLEYQNFQVALADETGKSDVEKTKLQLKLADERLTALEKERQALLRLRDASELTDEQSQRLNEISQESLKITDEQILARVRLGRQQQKEADDAKKEAQERAKQAKEESERRQKELAERIAAEKKYRAELRQAFQDQKKALSEQIAKEEELGASETERLRMQQANAIASIDIAEQQLAAKAVLIGKEEQLEGIRNDFAELRKLTNERFEREITKITEDELAKREEAENKRTEKRTADTERALTRLNEVIDKNADIEIQRLDILRESGDKELSLEQFKEKEKLKIQADALRKKRDNLIAFGINENSLEVKAIDAQLDQINNSLDNFFALPIFDRIKNRFKNLFDLSDEDMGQIKEQLTSVFDDVFSGLSALADMQVEQQQRVVDARQKSVDELQKQLDAELELNAKGVANNSDLLKQKLDAETELLKAEEEKRLALEKKAAQLRLRQEALQTASNISLSVAKVIAAESGKGLLGIVTAVAAVASIFALIAKAKAQAAAFETPKLRKGGNLGEMFSGKVLGKSHEQGGEDAWLSRQGKRINLEGNEFVMPVKETMEHGDFLEEMRQGNFKGFDLNKGVDFSRQFFENPVAMITDLAPKYGIPILPDLVGNMIPVIRKNVANHELAKKENERQVLEAVMSGYFGQMGLGLSRVETAIREQETVIPITDLGYMTKQKTGNKTTISVHEPPRRK